LFNFLVILCSQVFIPSLSSWSWMGSWNFSISLDFSRMGIKLPIFSPYGSYRLSWWGESIYTLYFPFLAFRPPFPLSALFSSIKSNPQQYRVYYNVSNYFAQKFIFKNFLNFCFF
jgi:hypothetical protein